MYSASDPVFYALGRDAEVRLRSRGFFGDWGHCGEDDCDNML